MSPIKRLFATLIRTHHITSRKKLQHVKKAASHFDVPFVLVRYGGTPGLMYAESSDPGRLNSLIGAVKDLRYKDFHCVCKPEQCGIKDVFTPNRAFNEVGAVSEFAEIMNGKGLGEWFKTGLLSKRAGQFDGDTCAPIN